MADLGLTFAYHQHTGTPIETREELYDLVDHVDTEIVKLGPDIGQLQKGGSDPVEVVRDFLPLINHVHLKDYSGGNHWVGYCPLGQGKVDIPAVMALLEEHDFKGSVMAELDPGRRHPSPPKKLQGSAGITWQNLATPSNPKTGSWEHQNDYSTL